MKAFISITHVALFIVVCLFAIFTSPWIWIVAAWFAFWLARDFYKAWQKVRAKQKNADG